MSENSRQRLALLGSTGSIGTQALEVVAAHPGRFEVTVLSAHKNVELLAQQARAVGARLAITTDESRYETLKQLLDGSGIEVGAGQSALQEAVQRPDVDTVLGAIVGFAGLQSTLAAIEAGKKIALANKETLVVAGELVMKRAAETGAQILPVDSEHSALFQCLVGEDPDAVEKIMLTASGGPFLGRKPNYLVNVKASHALQHPNWTMGAKISIDSATLMNKGLEMIEAKWLFGLRDEQIEVVVHPQSIVHSLVQFCDGSLKAQLGLPDMKLPIQYALAYPQRLPNTFKRFDFKDYGKLTFEAPDLKTFRNLALAIEAMNGGGNMPCILNAANEVVVGAFLQNKIGFLEMSETIESVLQGVPFVAHPDLQALEDSDTEARYVAAELVKKSALTNY
ncbi:MAG: 1-deoxy-D-xylulose-5-phosphate reductoisomerase [Sphingobacteriales bacterium]|nr:MAG: 1-deoxy-D-xylulose-5-phosphate reductoisomerase [Sphingobacteriales bacterium]